MSHLIVSAASLAAGFYLGHVYTQYSIARAMQQAVSESASAFLGALAPEATSPQKPEAPPPEPEPSPITATLLEKSFRLHDYSGSIALQDAIIIKVQFSNGFEKKVRAFDGTLEFRDLLGKPILGAGVTISDEIEPGQTYVWDGELKYNQFIGGHQRLRDTKARDLEAVFTVEHALFADGTKFTGA